jgi:hypothetical protein
MSENVLVQWPLVAFSVALSLASLLHLWLRRSGSPWRKAFWSLVIAVPLLGPFFYVTCYRIPRKKPDHEIPEYGHQY